MNLIQRFNLPNTGRHYTWKAIAIGALTIVIAAGVIRDGHLLSQYNVAVGIDGYYYVLQVDALKNNQRLYFPTRTPLVLVLFSLIRGFTNDSVSAVMLGSVLLHASLCFGVFALIGQCTASLWLGVLASALAAVSGLHLYMIAEFINALGALTFLIWSAWFAVRWVQTRRPKSVGLAVAFLAAAVFSHQLAGAVALIVAVSLLLYQGLVSSRLQGTYAFVPVVAVVAIFFSPAIAKAQAVIDIPERLRAELTAIPHWPISDAYFPETLMLSLLGPVGLILLLGPVRERAKTAGGKLLGSVAIWTLLVTLNPFFNESAGWTGIVGRLRGLAYIQVALLVPGVIWLVVDLRKRFVFHFLAVLPAFAILSWLAPLPLGLRSEYLFRRERLADQLPHYRQKVDNDALIMASHGDQFLVSSILGFVSQRLAPPSPGYSGVYWLLDIPKNGLPILESAALAKHPTSMTILVDDGVLRSYLLTATDVEKRTLLGYNRHLMIAYNRGGPGNPF